MINPSSQPIGSDTTEIHNTDLTESRDQPVSAGRVLRHAREANGLHIAALAVALKVPVKKLEALEMDRHDLLPDTVFVRALASSVCRTLKMDAAPVLALLPRSGSPAYRQISTPLQASFSAYPAAARSVSRSSASGPALVAGLLLVVSAAILIFLPTIKDATASLGVRSLYGDGILANFTGSKVESADVRGSGGQAAPYGSNVANASALVGNSTVDVVSGSPPALSPKAAINPPVLQIPQALNSGSTPPAAVSSTAGQSAIANSSSDHLVTFSAATQSSWVKVTDAKGAVVLSRTIAPGEAVFAAGALPLSVVVGRADATRVQVRGQAFDLANYSRENVARFEVK